MKLIKIPSEQRPILARLRAVALGFPQALEEVKWGHPNWTVRGKIFAAYGSYHERFSFGTKQSLVDQALLVEDPRFFRSPYVGKHGWVSMVLDGEVDWGLAERLVEQSYRLVAPKTLVRELDGETPARRKKA